MRTALAADLGGTKCRFALVAEDLSVHAATQVATVRERGPFLAAFDEAVARVLADRPAELAPPTAMGIGGAGLVTPAGDRLVETPSMPLSGYPLAEHVRERHGLPLALLNDGRASAWGEYVRGHAAGKDPLLCLFFGTGIGIGVMAGGRPYAGAQNAAGEVGHTMFRPGGRPCTCGEPGHFEGYCGGRGITERAEAEVGPAPGSGWTVGDVVAAADGDGPGTAAARAILADAEVAACVLVANTCTLFNPAAVVLGGGVLAGWPALRGSIEAYVRGNTRRLIHERLEFVPSLGGSDAILWGAAAATGLTAS